MSMLWSFWVKQSDPGLDWNFEVIFHRIGTKMFGTKHSVAKSVVFDTWSHLDLYFMPNIKYFALKTDPRRCVMISKFDLVKLIIYRDSRFEEFPVNCIHGLLSDFTSCDCRCHLKIQVKLYRRKWTRLNLEDSQFEKHWPWLNKSGNINGSNWW